MTHTHTGQHLPTLQQARTYVEKVVVLHLSDGYLTVNALQRLHLQENICLNLLPAKTSTVAQTQSAYVLIEFLINAHSTYFGKHRLALRKEMSSSSKGGESGIRINSTLIKKGIHYLQTSHNINIQEKAIFYPQY